MLTDARRLLDAAGCLDFARLVEANNGVWGGCWCMWPHGAGDGGEGYREDAGGRKASAALLINGALSTFERPGFERSRLIGKHKWVAARTIT
jgi:hypothetical protein